MRTLCYFGSCLVLFSFSFPSGLQLIELIFVFPALQRIHTRMRTMISGELLLPPLTEELHLQSHGFGLLLLNVECIFCVF